MRQHRNMRWFSPCDSVLLAITTLDEWQVAAVVKACAKTKTPIVPYGGATSLEVC